MQLVLDLLDSEMEDIQAYLDAEEEGLKHSEAQQRMKECTCHIL